MRRRILITAGVVAALAAVPVVAAEISGIDGSARSTAPAARVQPAGDVARVYNVNALRDDVAARAFAAARSAGGTAAITRSASLGMQRIWRGSALVQAAPTGWAIPMATSVLPSEAIGPIMGFDVSGVLSPTRIVMGRRTAELRGARAGDRIDVVASSGAVVSYVIGRIVDDDTVGGTELLMSTEAADRIGLVRQSSVVIWGFDSRAALDRAFAVQGLVATSIRIRRSWDPPDPDATLGMAATKEALGEFAYRVDPSTGALSIDSSWKNANITFGAVQGLRLSLGCHAIVRVALQKAMDEVVAAGLADRIDYGDANRYGGCFVPRFSRLAPDSNIGFLSRHTWGMAIDTNTQGSCQGCAPPDFATMPGGCDVVRIFRKHGFAWGGNFLLPDGMHFEWVGERRDHLAFPSRYCTNPFGGPLSASATPDVAATQRATLFADAGLLADG